jgi:rod shape determining protein RodA
VLLVLLAVAGLPIRILFMLLIGTALVAFVAVEGGLLHHYQIARLTTFLNPNSHSTNPFVQEAIYNGQQAKNAIGSGGLLGSGIGHGVATNLGYVPEQQTDFIFTAVGEELGFVGAATLLALFALVLWRTWRTARLAADFYGSLVCAGVLAVFAFQIFENIGMTMGIMPVTGIPLPFMSYGGSSLITSCASVALVANVYARRFD